MAVVGGQFSQLILEVGDVAVEVRAFRGALLPFAAGQVVGMVPIHDGMVPAHLDSLPPAGVGQFLHDVAFKRGRHDVEVGVFGVEQAEAVVVLGGDDDVLGPGILGDPDPLVGIEFHRIELLHKLFVLLQRDLAALANPFGVIGPAFPLASGHGVDAPVDEHPETGVAPPFHPLVAFGLGLGLHGFLGRLALGVIIGGSPCRAPKIIPAERNAPRTTVVRNGFLDSIFLLLVGRWVGSVNRRAPGQDGRRRHVSILNRDAGNCNSLRPSTLLAPGTKADAIGCTQGRHHESPPDFRMVEEPGRIGIGLP